MRQAEKNVFYTAVDSSAYEGYTPGSIPRWLMTTYIINAAIVALLAVWVVVTIRGYMKKNG